MTNFEKKFGPRLSDFPWYIGSGKGDHVHYGLEELCYAFRSLEQLLLDFDNDIDRLTR